MIQDRACNRCALSLGVNNICIFGDGPLTSEILVLGIAPGEYEDNLDQVFVGRSGQLLRKVLADLKLNPRIENVVRCRPPDNRDPTAKEVEACSPFLDTIVAAMSNLKFVVPLGAVPMRSLGVKSGVKEAAGKPCQMELWGKQVTVIPMMHPAAILRAPNTVSSWVAAWHGIVRLVNKDVADLGQVVTFDAYRKAPEPLAMVGMAGLPLSLDIETTGLDPEESSLLSVALGGPDVACAGPVASPEDIQALRDLGPLSEKLGATHWPEPVFVGHNAAAFDLPFLAVNAGVTIDPKYVVDTMLLVARLDPGESMSLGAAIARHVPQISGYKVETESEIAVAWRIADDTLLRRNGLDTIATRKLHDEVYPQVRKFTPAEVIAEDSVLAFTMRRIASTGVHLDETTMLSVEQEFDTQKQGASTQLAQMAGRTVNPQSNKQVGDYLTELLKLHAPEVELSKTTKDNYETGEIPLRWLAQRSGSPVVQEAVKHILDYREAVKLISTYVRGYAKKRGRKGRIYSSLRWPGTVSMRGASSNPNLQNVPRNKKVRSIFKAPPGYVFVEGDYSQIELRIAAALSRDRVLCEIFLTGGDPHTRLARRIFKLLDTEKPDVEQRTRAKTTNFGLLYGAGVNTLWEQFVKDGVFLEISEVARYYREFWGLYSDLNIWMEKQQAKVRAGEYLYSPTGHYRWNKKGMEYQHPGKPEDAVRAVVNCTIQSVPPRLTLKAARDVYADPRMKDFEICLQTHDGLLGYAREDRAEEQARVLKEHMEAQTTEPWWQGLPCPAAVKVGPSWGELHDL